MTSSEIKKHLIKNLEQSGVKVKGLKYKSIKKLIKLNIENKTGFKLIDLAK